MASAGFDNFIVAFQHRDFRIFMVGNIANHMGLWTQRMTAGWLAWELTGSATWLGLIGFADMAPVVVVAPLAGLLADRMNRLTIMRLSQAVIAGLAILLFGLMVAGWLTVGLLFVIFLLIGVVLSILLPARVALIPSLVGPESLHSAIAINSLVANCGRLLGPAIGGFIIVQWGIAASFAFCAVVFLVFTAALYMVRARQAPPDRKQQRGVLADLAAGVSYTRRHPGLGPLMMTMFVTAVIGRPFSTLYPGFAESVFDQGADGLALFTAAQGAGALIGGTYLARRPGIAGLTGVFVVNMAAIGVGLIVFGTVEIFWLAVMLVFGMGSVLLINSAASQTLIQHAVDEQMRGRLSGFYGVTQRGGQAVGALVLGVLGDLIGLQGTVIAAGAVCLVFWLWSFLRRRTMAKALEIPRDG